MMSDCLGLGGGRQASLPNGLKCANALRDMWASSVNHVHQVIDMNLHMEDQMLVVCLVTAMVMLISVMLILVNIFFINFF